MNKVIKWIAGALMVISVIILIWGFTRGWTDAAVNVLLYWAYAMVALAVCLVVVLGLFIATKNNPKSLVKIGLILAGAAVVCFLAYLLAPGSPAVGYAGSQLPSESTLKLTDTILNLTYLFGGVAILSILAGEIISSIRAKKA